MYHLSNTRKVLPLTKLLAALAVIAALALVITAAASWVTRRRKPLAITTGKSSAVPARSAIDRAMLGAQLKAVAAVGFSIATFVALFRAAIAFSGMLGLPLALVSGLSVSAGLLLFSALPSTKLSAQTTASATLTPRRPWSFGSRSNFIVPAAIAAIYIAFLIVTGLTSAPDDEGRYRVLRLEDAVSSSAASPYPGWYYGIPLILVTVALAGSAMLALHRISATHALPDPRMAGLDRRWREISTQVVLRLGTGALLAYVGGTALVAGQAMANVAMSGPGSVYRQPLLGLGVGLGILGAALAVIGVVLLVLAAKASLTIRASAQEQASADQPTPSRATP